MAITSRMLRERGQRQAQKLGVDPDRVPPGQYLTERFPVLTVGPNPKFDLSAWDFGVFGQVEDRLKLSWDELLDLPQKDVVTDIHCVTRWSKLDTVWRGVPVTELLERITRLVVERLRIPNFSIMLLNPEGLLEVKQAWPEGRGAEGLTFGLGVWISRLRRSTRPARIALLVAAAPGLSR
mgnify:CR=1 FL=1